MVHVVSATCEQQLILANLLELYIHDFCEFHSIPLDAYGRFGYPRLPLYWQEPNRYPFLIFVDGSVAGFVLIQRGSEISGDEEVWDVAEFFVVRGQRRRGVGAQTVHQVLTRFPGQWEVRVMASNRGALEFWQRAVDQFAGRSTPPRLVPKGDAQCYLFSFHSGPEQA